VLIAHPGVQIMARDRAKVYADGARQGAPKATQVADRFHLRQHVAEALEQVCSAHGQVLTAVNAVMCQAPILQSDGSMAAPIPVQSNYSNLFLRQRLWQASRCCL